MYGVRCTVYGVRCTVYGGPNYCICISWYYFDIQWFDFLLSFEELLLSASFSDTQLSNISPTYLTSNTISTTTVSSRDPLPLSSPSGSPGRRLERQGSDPGAGPAALLSRSAPCSPRRHKQTRQVVFFTPQPNVSNWYASGLIKFQDNFRIARICMILYISKNEPVIFELCSKPMDQLTSYWTLYRTVELSSM